MPMLKSMSLKNFYGGFYCFVQLFVIKVIIQSWLKKVPFWGLSEYKVLQGHIQHR